MNSFLFNQSAELSQYFFRFANVFAEHPLTTDLLWIYIFQYMVYIYLSTCHKNIMYSFHKQHKQCLCYMLTQRFAYVNIIIGYIKIYLNTRARISSKFKNLQRTIPVLTFKVNQPVSIEVNIPEDLINLSVVELLSHQFLHGFPQFSQTDLTITIGIKLRERDQLKDQFTENCVTSEDFGIQQAKQIIDYYGGFQ